MSCRPRKCFTRRGLYPDLAYTFKHALTHEMAYGSLLRETRRMLHRRVGEAIEAIYPDRLAELAGDPDGPLRTRRSLGAGRALRARRGGKGEVALRLPGRHAVRDPCSRSRGQRRER